MHEAARVLIGSCQCLAFATKATLVYETLYLVYILQIKRQTEVALPINGLYQQNINKIYHTFSTLYLQIKAAKILDVNRRISITQIGLFTNKNFVSRMNKIFKYNTTKCKTYRSGFNMHVTTEQSTKRVYICFAYLLALPTRSDKSRVASDLIRRATNTGYK